MKKSPSFKLLTIFLLAGGIFLFSSCNKFQKGAKKIVLKNQQDSTKYYMYHIIYPDSAMIQVIADSMQHFARHQKQMFMKAQPSDTSGYNVTPYELLVKFERVFHSPQFVSYLGNVYKFTGGAHGRSIIKTMNYDVKNRHFVMLKDLFQDTTALKPISRFAIKQITEEIYQKDSEVNLRSSIKQWLERGAAPIVKNYRLFYPAGKHHPATGLKFIFSPYQVGPHSIGIPKIFIPDSIFYDELSPAYRSLFKKPE